MLLYSDTPAKHRIGILIVALATLCFASLDTSAKWLVTHIPILEIVWLRLAIHALLAATWLIPQHGLKIFIVQDFRLQLIRSAMLAAMTALNFFALQYLQLAQTAAILFSSPILIAVISCYFYKEPLSTPKWCAIIGGFIGVLIILDPFGHGFHPAMILILIHATIFAFFNFLTRKIAAHSDPGVTQFYSALGPTIVLAPFVFFSWENITSTLDIFVIFLTGFFGFLSHFLLGLAYRYAKPATLSPFFYQQMIYMALFGWLVFGQTPNLHVIVGTILVIGSGLYLWFQEIHQENK